MQPTTAGGCDEHPEKAKSTCRASCHIQRICGNHSETVTPLHPIKLLSSPSASPADSRPPQYVKRTIPADLSCPAVNTRNLASDVNSPMPRTDSYLLSHPCLLCLNCLPPEVSRSECLICRWCALRHCGAKPSLTSRKTVPRERSEVTVRRRRSTCSRIAYRPAPRQTCLG